MMKAANGVCLALLCAACGTRPAAPAPMDEPPPRPANGQTGSLDGPRRFAVCVVEDGRLREVEVTYDMVSGDTTYQGRPFAEAFPDTVGYAVSRRWWIENEPIRWQDRRYIKYGMVRRMAPRELRPVGEYDGVAQFTEAANPGSPDVLYVPVRPGCEFQSYQWDLTGTGVRGR